MVARARAGMTVRVLYDWFGSLRLVGRWFWAPLRAVGGEVRRVILDVRMPEMNGLDLQRQMITRAWRVPIILITSHADDHAQARALGDGAVAFLYKPCREGDLLNAIEAVSIGPPYENMGARLAIVRQSRSRRHRSSAMVDPERRKRKPPFLLHSPRLVTPVRPATGRAHASTPSRRRASAVWRPTPEGCAANVVSPDRGSRSEGRHGAAARHVAPHRWSAGRSQG